MKKRKELTDRQDDVLGEIKHFMKIHKYPPTNMELAAALGFSSINAAVQHLKAIEHKGHIKIAKDTPRGIKITDGTGCAFCGSKK